MPLSDTWVNLLSAGVGDGAAGEILSHLSNSRASAATRWRGNNRKLSTKVVKKKRKTSRRHRTDPGQAKG